MKHKVLISALFVFQVFALLPAGNAVAHCDTLGGPVVESAKAALESGDIMPVLKWVRSEDEAEIRNVFERVISVREKGDDARLLADMYFFETLVRIHRAGEGAPYTGLKPAGDVEPVIKEANVALDNGKVDELAESISSEVEHGVREHFKRTYEAKQHADDNVESGRKFVEAYVEFTHYVERLHEVAAGRDVHHSEPDAHGH